MNTMVGVKFVGVEIFSFVRRKRWMLIFLIVAGYLLLSESNILFTFRSHLSLNPWQLVVMVWGGPSFQPPVFQILGWLILPTAFVLGVGEPFSLLQMPWIKVLLSRSGTRWRYWWGRLIAWYTLGLFFVVTVIGLSLVLIGFTASNLWKFPSVLILNGQPYPSTAVFAWVALNLLTTIWWYTTVLITYSIWLPRPGLATIATLITGCVLTFTGAHMKQAILFLRPFLGAQLNLFQADGLNVHSLLHFVYNCCVWFLLGMVDYLPFRFKHL